MSKLPHLSGKDMVRFVEQHGYVLKRISGSHHFFAKGRDRVCVPVHAGKQIRIGTLMNILRSMHLSAEEFLRLWNE